MTVITVPRAGDLLFYARKNPNKKAFQWESLCHVAVIVSYEKENDNIQVAHVTDAKENMGINSVKYKKDMSYYYLPLRDELGDAMYAMTLGVQGTKSVYYTDKFANKFTKNMSFEQVRNIANQSNQRFCNQIPRVMKYALRGNYLVGNHQSEKQNDIKKGMMCSQLVATLLQSAQIRISDLAYTVSNKTKGWISNKYGGKVGSSESSRIIQNYRMQYGQTSSDNRGFLSISCVLNDYDFKLLHNYIQGPDFPAALRYDPKYVSPASLLYHLTGGVHFGGGSLPFLADICRGCIQPFMATVSVQSSQGSTVPRPPRYRRKRSAKRSHRRHRISNFVASVISVINEPMEQIIQKALSSYQNNASGRKRVKLNRRLKFKPVKAKSLTAKPSGKRKATRTEVDKMVHKRRKSARSFAR